MNEDQRKELKSSVAVYPEEITECSARIDRIDAMIDRGLSSSEKAATRLAGDMEKPVAIYFGLDEEESAGFCLWLVEYLLRNGQAKSHS